jgi:hypothetical protein
MTTSSSTLRFFPRRHPKLSSLNPRFFFFSAFFWPGPRIVQDQRLGHAAPYLPFPLLVPAVRGATR